MKILKPLLEIMMESQGSQVMLNSRNQTFVKKSKSWTPTTRDILQKTDLKMLVNDFLTAEESHEFKKNNYLQKFSDVSPFSILVQITKHHDYYQIQIDAAEETLKILNSWNLPASFPDLYLSAQSLNFVQSSQSLALDLYRQAIRSELSQKKRVSVIELTSGSPTAESESHPFLLSIPIEKMEHLPEADVVFLNIKDLSELSKAYQLSQKGYAVVCFQKTAQLQNLLQNVSDVLDPRPQVGSRWFSQAFGSAIGVVLAPGLESLKVPVAEVLIKTLSMKKNMLENQWDLVWEEQKTSGDRTGMRSLNQALFQMLIKRKIDLKEGFQLSPDPVDLDLQLKKVGF